VELQAAKEYKRSKDWTKAESSYRAILESYPDNREAAFGLSDVLYQEQKYEESAAVLNKLNSAKSN
jgi:TolA-binding protein